MPIIARETEATVSTPALTSRVITWIVVVAFLLIVCIRSHLIFGRPPTSARQTLPILSSLTAHSLHLTFWLLPPQKLSASPVCFRWMIVANQSWSFLVRPRRSFENSGAMSRADRNRCRPLEKLELDLAQTRRIC